MLRSIKKGIRKIIMVLIPKKVKAWIREPVLLRLEEAKGKLEETNKSYSQEGEDLILERIFNDKKDGFFIDLGCHDPVRFSNTYKFYNKGWRGINVDASASAIERFDKQRPNDINVHAVLGEKGQEYVLRVFSDPALNTISERVASHIVDSTDYIVVKEKKVYAEDALEIILKNNVENKEIDFITIDLEGMDFQVLSKLSIEKLMPKALVIESKVFDLTQPKNNEIVNYLECRNYKLYSKLYNSLIFIKVD